MSRRPTFTDRRRALLARRVDTLEAMEPRAMITESLGILALGIGVPAMAAAVARKDGGEQVASGRQPRTHRFTATSATAEGRKVDPIAGRRAVRGEGGWQKVQAAPAPLQRAKADGAGDWLTLFRSPASTETPTLLNPPPMSPARASQAGGGTALGGAGGAGRGTVTPLRIPPGPATTQDAPPLIVAGEAVAGHHGATASPAQVNRSAAIAEAMTGGTAGASLAAQQGRSTPQGNPLLGQSLASSGGSTGYDPGLFDVANFAMSGPSTGTFDYFPVYTLDYNHGVVLFPGYAQLASPGGNVDLRAQVRDAVVTSYSWDTSGLVDAVGQTITGTNTYRLQFQWSSSFSVDRSNTATLTVTDDNSNQEVHTYTFRAFVGTGSAGSAPSWPEALAPNTVVASAASFASHNVSVDANSGALDTTIPLPSYNPNLPPLALVYDSLAADPRPIIVEHHTIDPALSVPTQVSAQLTFNATAGTTYYYDTALFNPGDIQQIALQADATALSTGRYAFTVSLGDIRGSTTTSTVNGTATVINESANPIGQGWTVRGLERIHTATGGVILNLGEGGRSLWFAGAFGGGGGTYTSPAGEFSTLVIHANGTYTRTHTDGTQVTYGTDGRETATIDRSGLRVTFAYDSGGRLETVSDPYGKITTFTYSSGLLQTITDPASRIATFTHSGSKLSGVTLPDASTWAYAYDGSGRLTQVTDPNSHTTTVAYSSAQRVVTITRPDTSVQTFVSYQERGWTNSGTSMSPAAPTLLAEARASHTDPLSNTTDLRPDWNGLGLTGQVTDADGNVMTFDRDGNGLATVSIDRLSRITRQTFDASGNPVTITYPRQNTDHFTYNGFSQPLTHTDGNSHTTTFTYDGNGNLTVVKDALSKLTTLTYTGNGKLATLKDANTRVTSYAYDNQDRLTTVINPDTSTVVVAYDSKGNPTTSIDERSNVTTFSYDALNRMTGATDAIGARTTHVFDPAGNRIAIQAPLSRTTSYAYDVMDRLTTVTDPLLHATVVTYDSGGNIRTVTDPLNRITTYIYDALNRRIVAKDPLGRLTTTTYNAEGETTEIKDPLLQITNYSRDSNGWIATSVDPLGQVTTYTYSGTGKLLTVSDPATSGGLFMQYTYDADDRRITATDALAHTTTTTYDDVGNVIAVTDANNHTTSYAYDSRNRLTTITDALGHATALGYDSTGNRTSVKNALGHTTTRLYDALNRVTTITDALSGQTVVAYDSGGRQTLVVDPNGNRTTFAYDVADRLTTLTNPNGATTTYVYDSANELTDRTDFNGRRVTFAYDSGGRQTAERWLSGSGGTIRTITYGYDNADRLTGVTDPDATLTFTYDSGGNQITARTSGTAGQPDVTLASTYNESNQRTSVADNLSSPARTTFTYDVAHRLVSITNSIGFPRVDFGYDAANNRTSITRGDTGGSNPPYVITSMAYDAANRLTTLTHLKNVYTSGGGYATTLLATYVYGYDNANRLTSEQNAEGTVTYGYDNTNQLTGASGSRAETYTYDSGGNRTMSGYGTGTGNEMTSGAGYTYAYDIEGNLTAKTQTSGGTTVTTYSYDYRNRLTGVTVRASLGGSITNQATYTYDALNRRIGMNVNSTQTWTVYDGQNTYADFGAGGSGGAALQTRYLYGPAVDELLGRADSGGNEAWHLGDRLGTVRDIVDTSGGLLDHLSYDSFGKLLTESSPANGDRFKFTGREYDSATNLYFYRARYYDGGTGRFIGRDPLGFAAGDYNLYRYVTNNSTNFVDPQGTNPLIAIGGGALIGGIVAGGMAWQSPGSTWSGVGASFLGGAVAGATAATGGMLIAGTGVGMFLGGLGTAAGGGALGNAIALLPSTTMLGGPGVTGHQLAISLGAGAAFNAIGGVVGGTALGPLGQEGSRLASAYAFVITGLAEAGNIAICSLLTPLANRLADASEPDHPRNPSTSGPHLWAGPPMPANNLASENQYWIDPYCEVGTDAINATSRFLEGLGLPGLV